MSESVRLPLVVGYQEVMGHGLPERIDEGTFRKGGDLLEQWVLYALAGGRGNSKHLLGVVGQGIDADHDRITQRRRQLMLDRFLSRAYKLLDVEGIAFRERIETLNQLRVWISLEDAPQLLENLSAAEAVHFQPIYSLDLIERREEGTERVAPVDLVAPMGGEEHGSRMALVAHEEPHEIP